MTLGSVIGSKHGACGICDTVLLLLSVAVPGVVALDVFTTVAFYF